MATVILSVCRLVRVCRSRPHKTGGASELYLWENTLDVVCAKSCNATSIFRIHDRSHTQPQNTILRHITNSDRQHSTRFGTTQWTGDINEVTIIARRGAEKARVAHRTGVRIRRFNPFSQRFKTSLHFRVLPKHMGF